MGWSCGWSDRWQRDIGYGVPAVCDHPVCGASIDRGFSYLCGTPPYGDDGCGLYFCGDHLTYSDDAPGTRCERCWNGDDPFTPTADTPEWVHWKLTDDSWADWRDANPDKTAELRAFLDTNPYTPDRDDS